MSVTGPAEETPCVHTGLSAVAAETMTTAVRAPTRTTRTSLHTRRLVTIADPIASKTHRRNNDGGVAAGTRSRLRRFALKVAKDLADVAPSFHVVFDREGRMAT